MAGAYVVRAPGPWQAQRVDLRSYTGVAWYRLRFTPPAVLRDGQAWHLRHRLAGEGGRQGG